MHFVPMLDSHINKMGFISCHFDFKEDITQLNKQDFEKAINTSFGLPSLKENQKTPKDEQEDRAKFEKSDRKTTPEKEVVDHKQVMIDQLENSNGLISFVFFFPFLYGKFISTSMSSVYVLFPNIHFRGANSFFVSSLNRYALLHHQISLMLTMKSVSLIKGSF